MRSLTSFVIQMAMRNRWRQSPADAGGRAPAGGSATSEGLVGEPSLEREGGEVEAAGARKVSIRRSRVARQHRIAGAAVREVGLASWGGRRSHSNGSAMIARTGAARKVRERKFRAGIGGNCRIGAGAGAVCQALVHGQPLEPQHLGRRTGRCRRASASSQEVLLDLAGAPGRSSAAPFRVFRATCRASATFTWWSIRRWCRHSCDCWRHPRVAHPPFAVGPFEDLGEAPRTPEGVAAGRHVIDHRLEILPGQPA